VQPLLQQILTQYNKNHITQNNEFIYMHFNNDRKLPDYSSTRNQTKINQYQTKIKTKTDKLENLINNLSR